MIAEGPPPATASAPLLGARRLVAAGNSVVAVPPDGSKHPATAWKTYQARRPTDAELVAWFGSGRNGPAVVTGAISGQREVVDVDRAALFAPYGDEVERRCPGLMGRVTVVQTPRPGYQLHYRCPAGVAGNQPLAREPKTPTDADPAPFATLIETRGEGGLALTPACPPDCHPTGRPYRLLQGDFAAPAAVSATERAVLLEAARTFNTYTAPRLVSGGGPALPPERRGDRPGDHFNARMTWAQLLEPHGWRPLFAKGDVTVWKRPGKDTPGGSATTNFGGSDLFYPFSSNAAPFEPETAYTKFAAYALLQHGGDFGAAARELRREGYGAPPVAIDLGRRPNPNGTANGPPPPPRDADGPAGGPRRPPPEIDAGNLNLPDVTDQAWAALLDYNEPPRLFRYGDALSRLETDDRGGTVTRALTEDRLRHHLARAADWYRWKKDGKDAPAKKVPDLPPVHVVKDLLATPDAPLPPLTRVVAAPVFAPDGEVVTAPGYHAASRTYYAPRPGAAPVPPVPAAPAAADVARAKALLLDELLVDFPFTGASERAHAVALLLLPFLRGMIDGPTPLHLIEKPTVGTGATLLAEALVYPAAGAKPAPMVEGRDDEEWRKRLTATLRESPAAVLIDNLRRKLDTPALAAALTAPDAWADRLLGTSETVHLPVRCAWIATGNNPALSDELARRAVRIRLDAQVEQPHLREPKAFKHGDLSGWAAAHRHELVWAALVLGRAWVAQGRPPGARVLGSFESWARVVGGVLETAGIGGFLGNLQELYERANEERAAWVAFVGAWWDTFGSAPTLVKDLFPLVAESEIPLALGDPTKKHSGPVSLGTKIRQAEGRIFTGKRIERAGEKKHAILWRLAPLAGGPGASPPPETHRDSPPDSPPEPGGPHLGNQPAGESGESGESFLDPHAQAHPQAPARARPGGPEATPPDSPGAHIPGEPPAVSLGGVSAQPGGETPPGDSPARGKCDYCGRPMHALREVHGQIHVLCRVHDFGTVGGAG
ncbi:MAG TPA: hypothetical protein VNK05_05220 [Chloroflexota bacterium]|nr:hypothetical protein [Chloroflexota bacterium]